MSSENAKIPLLVVESIQRDDSAPNRLQALIRVGGHPLRVVLDFTRRDLGLIEYVELPGPLGMHVPSQQAVVDLIARVDAGEAPELPVDLSEQVLHADPPFPWTEGPHRAALDAAARQVDLEVVSCELVGDAPSRFTAMLRVDGRPIYLRGDIYAGPNRIPIMRWEKGPDPQSLSAAQHYAIQRELLRRYAAARSGAN